MSENANGIPRVIGLDAHPDSFTAAVLNGPTPAAAIVEKLFHKVPLGQLSNWAKKYTTPQDVIVMEASGNSFHLVRVLEEIERKALVLESCQVGKLKDAHANNDKISAVRIGKAYLAGTAKTVWVPDAKTQEWRDLFHAHRKAVKRTTQMRNRLLSYLSDHGVRLKPGTPLTRAKQAEGQLRGLRNWSAMEWQVIEGMVMELQHADEQRSHWRSVIAQEVLRDATLVSLVRLCGVRDIVAFALGAIIGDIERFAKPGKLVKYFGLDPAFDDSGNEEWSGGIRGHGRKDVRSLLIEGAQSILRSGKTDLARWSRRLLARKRNINLVAAATARKLTVSVWYLLKGRWTALEELDGRLKIKVGKMISAVGPKALKQMGKSRRAYREEICRLLKTGRKYVSQAGKTMDAATSGRKAAAAAALA